MAVQAKADARKILETIGGTPPAVLVEDLASVKRDAKMLLESATDEVNSGGAPLGLPPATAAQRPAEQAVDNVVAGGSKLLVQLQALPGGDQCADCNAASPSWASSNTGALICINCVGVHRLIGTEFSAPLSVKLDDWALDQVEIMKRGNDAVNAKLEATLDPALKLTPNSEREARETFIWSKYARKSFSDGGCGKLIPLPEDRGGGGKGGRHRSESNIGTIVYQGILFLVVKRATDLKNKDFVGKSDPYLLCRVGSAPQAAVTRVIKNNLNPEWNQELVLNVPSLEDTLFIEVWDCDGKGDKQTEQGRHGDDLLGVAYGPDISGFCVVRGTVDPADGHSNITQVVPPCQESWRRSPYERTDLLGEDNYQVGVSLSGLADGERHTIRCKVVDPGAREEHQALGGELLLEARFEALDQ